MACQTCVCMQTHRSHKNTFIRAGRESNPKGGRRGGNKQEDFFEETLVRISLICTSQTEPYFYADGEKSPRRRLYIALSVLLKEPSTTHLSCSAGMLRTLQTVSLKEGTCFWSVHWVTSPCPSSSKFSHSEGVQQKQVLLVPPSFLTCSSPRLVEWTLEDLPMQPAHLASVQRFPAP